MADARASVGVGIIGLGTIGTGVVQVLQEHASEIEGRLGFALELVRAADLDLARSRPVDLSRLRLSQEASDVIADPDVDLVIELVGGTGVAREIVLRALAEGKPVVTANKALLAHHGAEIYDAAHAAGVDILFEASVGGTIPVLRALREGLCADRILSLHGIVNGTCNFILTEMEATGESYPVCLKRAQELGYAESDPTFDVEGVDSAHKLAILLGLALGVDVPVDGIPTRGITSVEPLDLDYARQFGLRIKLLAIGKRLEGAIDARVEPTLISAQSVLAGVDGAMNAVEVRGLLSGPTLYYGAGAGALPTASAVVADAMEIARGLRAGVGGRVPPLGAPRLSPPGQRAGQEPEAEFYVRFSVLDEPGVLAEITRELSNVGISIASVLQPERHSERSVPVVLMTHPAPESALRVGIEAIERRPQVRPGTQLLRIEREL